jgi:hypothetical protein
MSSATATQPQLFGAAGHWPGGVVRRVIPQFNIGQFAQALVALLALFLLNKGGTLGSVAFFFILLVLAATGTAGSLKALAIVGLGVQLNQFFVPKTMIWGPGRIGLTAFCCLRIFIDVAGSGAMRIPATVITLTVFAFTAAVCSMLSGYYVHIALLKLLNFWTGAAAILLGTEYLRRRRYDLSQWFVSLIYVIVVVGVAAIAVGQSRNYLVYRGAAESVMASSLFNGAFLHPNTHSSIAAPALTFLLAATIYGRYRNRWITALAAALLAYFVVTSRSRSALASAIVGATVLVLYARPVRQFGHRLLRPNIRRGTLVALAAALFVLIGTYDQVRGGRIAAEVIAFINKSKNTESVDSGDIIKSREGKIRESWQVFLTSPIYGIGFQVQKSLYFQQNATLFTAPAEKGFLPTAVLEEGGILGATTFVIFLFTFARSLIRSKNIPGMAVAASVFLSTIPEVAIFAMGGAATYMWSIMGAAMIMGDHCWTGAAIRGRGHVPPEFADGRLSATG